jgi:Na+-transporting methylmalonyl-CoA/oxaloacetate decarboxylase gamma subunit
MGKNIFKVRKRKGQVFLLLSIVILIYLVLLSTTVYRITQSPYIVPAPNQEQINFYVENSISSLEQLVDVAISQYSRSYSVNSIIVLITEGIAVVESFLDGHNLPSTLTFDNSTFSISNSSTSANPTYITCSMEISIHIASPDFYFDATFVFEATYYLEISETTGTENYIYVYKISNSHRTIISDATITIEPTTPVSNLLDGRYEADLQVGQVISAVLPNNILLWLEV